MGGILMKEKLCHILVAITDLLGFITLCATVFIEIIIRYVSKSQSAEWSFCNWQFYVIIKQYNSWLSNSHIRQLSPWFEKTKKFYFFFY